MVPPMLRVLLSAETTTIPELCLGFPHTPVGKILQGFSLSFQTEVFLPAHQFLSSLKLLCCVSQ